MTKGNRQDICYDDRVLSTPLEGYQNSYVIQLYFQTTLAIAMYHSETLHLTCSTVCILVHCSTEDSFLAFDFCRFFVVIRVFSSPPQRPMTSDFEGFLYQILSITLFSYLNS